MSEPKYYTPSIEEFHVGFECEVYHPHSLETKDGFEPETYAILTEVWWNRSMENLILNKEVRVKYLDREDIESLGWNPAYYNDYEFNIGEFTLEWRDEKFPVKITKGGHTIFQSTIRNKSELKRVMKMVGIKNEKL